MPRFHLIPNAHLDPVWLWDWREGLTEGIATCRAVLDLMDEFPELTFVRGEASIYEHIERHDPETLERIRAQVKTGRWDVVGGNYVQPDTNLPATEVLVRQFSRGLGYFKKTLGVRPTVAWAPDSFGHSAGWPEIYAAAGLKYFAFSRPFANDLALPGPAFWWEGPGASRVLAWRMPIEWYGSTRSELPGRLDKYQAAAAAWGLDNIAIFFGLGDHGGGPSRAQIEAVLRWRDCNPGVTVEFSTLHRFFAALSREADKLKAFRGELNFALRGCYASAASVKFAYRRAENLLLRSERTSSAVAALTGGPAFDLHEAWDGVLFNTFHDILPGSSIERALAEQRAWIGSAQHQAQSVEFAALSQLARDMDTTVPPARGDRPTVVPVLLWNSLPVPFEGPVEFEVPLDYRPLDDFRGRPDEVPLEVRDSRGRVLPHQSVATEHDFASDVPWRKRLVVHTRIPACGWHLLTAGWRPDAKKIPLKSDLTVGSGRIANSHWRIATTTGAHAISLTHAEKRLALRALSVDDSWGSWGGHDGEKEAEHVNRVTTVWTIAAAQVLERGPERAALWVKLTAEASWLELTFLLYRDDPAIVVRARAFWTEKAARLKLEFSPSGGVADFEVPGGTVRRSPCGEVPGGRWVRVGAGGNAFVFASDALYNFDLTKATFGATIVRSTRYAAMNRATPNDQPWRPHMDLGEHGFQFAIGASAVDPAALAQRLESPPVTLIVPAHPGHRTRTGSVLTLTGGLELLAFAPAASGDGWILRTRNGRARPVTAAVRLLGRSLALGRVLPGRIRTFLLRKRGNAWRVDLVSAAEEPISE